MLDYYNREQYGDWLNFYGQNYTAYLDNYGIEKMMMVVIKRKNR